MVKHYRMVDWYDWSTEMTCTYIWWTDTIWSTEMVCACRYCSLDGPYVVTREIVGT